MDIPYTDQKHKSPLPDFATALQRHAPSAASAFSREYTGSGDVTWLIGSIFERNFLSGSRAERGEALFFDTFLQKCDERIALLIRYADLHIRSPNVGGTLTITSV